MTQELKSKLIKINDEISYLDASEDPISSNVVFIKPKNSQTTWIFDVGLTSLAAQEINAIQGKKIVVISHFHPDHLFNINRISYDELYLSAHSFKYAKKGIVVKNKEFSVDSEDFLFAENTRVAPEDARLTENTRVAPEDARLTENFFVVPEDARLTENQLAQAANSQSTENQLAQVANSRLTENQLAQAANSRLTENQLAQAANSRLTENFFVVPEDARLTENQLAQAANSQLTENQLAQAANSRLTENQLAQAANSRLTENQLAPEDARLTENQLAQAANSQSTENQLAQAANSRLTENQLAQAAENPKIKIMELPSSHAKGSLMLQYGDYVFTGDGTYCTTKNGKHVYNANLLFDEIQTLENLDCKYLCLSHERNFIQKKETVLKLHKDIYSRRKVNEAYISVEDFFDSKGNVIK